jgi:Zn-dependent protease with chaperone function
MVLLFLLAVVAIVLAVDLVLAAFYVWGHLEFADGDVPGFRQMLGLAPKQLWLWGALATAGVIFVVSTVNVMRLGGGGAAVADMVGARRVPSNTTDPLERRLRNVVEEMAIASGVRVPAVYVMDGERGINAFAAGWDVSGAVVAVTRGTLERLTRDELQGVVAHEFSHILNGDMRLNVRMLGVLAGIVFIGSIGEFVMRSTRGSSSGRGAAGLFFAGAAIFLIGYIGLFFARLIKASVSREREFLADASSVQFTRNPDGIAGALDQIRASPVGTLITNRYAEEMSHMFFGKAVSVLVGPLFDTHPPLEERIKRVHPRFQPSAYREKRQLAPVPAREAVVERPTGRRASDLAVAWGRSPVESAALVGTLDAGKIDFAARLLAALPEALRESLREPEGARAAVIALLLADAAAATRQLEAIPDRSLAERARTAAALVRGFDLALHLPVIDLALPALKTMPEAATKHFLAALEAVVYADRRVSLHEFVVLTLLRAQLAPGARPAETKTISALQAEAATVLALLAHAGTRADASGARQEALQAALRAGAKVLGIGEDLPAKAPLTLDSARRALEALRSLAPMQKGILVKGLFAAVTVDGTIRVAEAGVMRLVGAVLDCPLPPLLASLDPGTLAA